MIKEKKYYVYMLRCKDNSIYTGITTDITKRMTEHFSKDENCAKYTYSHTAEKLEELWETENRKLASKLEFCIKKKLNKPEKEKLINYNETMKNLLKNLNSDDYIRLDVDRISFAKGNNENNNKTRL